MLFALDDADRLSSALAVLTLQRQGPVDVDMESPGLAVDQQAGLVGVRGGAFRKLNNSGLLP